MLKPLTLAVFLMFSVAIKAQIGIGTTSPHSSSILDISSSNKGFLPPRLTLDQRNQIQNPAAGLMIYCYDCCPNPNDDGRISLFIGNNTWHNMPDCSPTGGIMPNNDFDLDGIINSVDIDDDNDGILDTLETWTITRLEQQLGFDIGNPTLESGQAKRSGAVYRYTKVQGDIDLKVSIIKISGPVSIVHFDKSTVGEVSNFNPVINYRGNGNDQGQVDLKFDFVKTGTNSPVMVPYFLLSPRDVDGSGSYSQMGEFQIVRNPDEIIVDNNSTLTITQDGNDYRVEGNPSMTNPGIGPQKEYLTSTFFSNRSSVEISLGIQKMTAGSQNHDRLFSISAQPNELKNYDLPDLISGFRTFKKNSDDDSDEDQFDNDSDNDGCSDSYEANLTRSKDPNFKFPIDQVGANGLYDGIETFPDSGILKRKPDIEKPYNDKVKACE